VRVSFYLRSMARESRGIGGRMVFFVACLAVGVAAVASLAGLSSGLDATIRAEARQLLAADVAVGAQRPIPAGLERFLAGLPRTRKTDVRTLATIVSAPAAGERGGASLLVQMKVVSGDYPFYGNLRLDPDRPLAELLDGTSAVVAGELLERLGIAGGGTIRIGGQPFRVSGTVVSEPDRIDFGFRLGPRVFLSAQGLERAGLASRGSSIFYRTLLKLPEGSGRREAEELAARIKEQLGGDAISYQVENFADAQPALRNALKRADRFLGLVALLSLLIGGVGIAQTTRSWLEARMDAIAVLRCLGMRPREVVALYLGQTLFLGLVGSLVGAAASTALLAAAPRLLAGIAREVRIDPFQPLALLRGIVLGVTVAALFSFPRILAARRVPPLRVLRRSVEPLPAGKLARAASAGLLGAGTFATAFVQSGSLKLAAGFTLALAALVAVLALAGWLVAQAVGRAPRRFTRVWVRHGLAALARPGADALGTIVALGLGTLVVLAMHLVEAELRRSLEADLPRDAPTAFFVDIQPDQWEGVRALLEREGATNLRSVPMVNARLASVDGKPVSEIAGASPEERDRRRWALTREQNLAYLAELPEDNRIVAGAWWSDPTLAEASVERDFAGILGAKLGSRLVFDVQGVEVGMTVTSLREIEWRSFRPNFFLVVEPGVLENAPQTRVAAAHLPPGREQEIQDAMSRAYPNVLVIKIREMLEKVAGVLEKVGRGVRFLGAFSVVAGAAILAGAVGAGAVRRGREVALLKTLGMTRVGVVLVFAVEYCLVGLVAGLIGAVGGGILAWAVVTHGMELTWETRLLPFALAVVGSMGVSFLSGTLASARALTRRPVEVLRVE